MNLQLPLELTPPTWRLMVGLGSPSFPHQGQRQNLVGEKTHRGAALLLTAWAAQAVAISPPTHCKKQQARQTDGREMAFSLSP